MKKLLKKRQFWLLLLLLLLLLTAPFTFPTVYWRVVGWKNGESFYRGRPTSYRVREVQQRDWRELPHADILLWSCPPSLFERNYWLSSPQKVYNTTGNCPLLESDAAALRVLVELLNHEDRNVRILAAEGLARLGPQAKLAVDRLFEIVRCDEDWTVSNMATQAIGRISPELTEAADECYRNRRFEAR